MVRENIGREAETYLSHIIENYDRLYGHYVFCQAFPFDHMENIIIGTEPRGYNTGKGDPNEVIRFFNTYEPCGSYIPLGLQFCCDLDGKPHFACNLKAELDALFVNFDKPIVWFVQGAQFIVSAECIRARPREFYEKILQRSREYPGGMDAYAHVMERLWGIVFNPYYRHRV